MSREDLTPILDTLREVGESLDKRARRAAAATGVTWGIVASSIFAFYAWVHFRHEEPLVQALHAGGLLDWMWVLPVGVGYAITLALGARLGRLAPRSDEARRSRWLALVLLIPVTLVVVSNLLDVGERYIPAMWVAFLAIVNLQWRIHRGSPVEKVATLGSLAMATALLFTPPSWAYAGASAWYLVTLAGFCVLRYHRA